MRDFWSGSGARRGGVLSAFVAAVVLAAGAGCVRGPSGPPEPPPTLSVSMPALTPLPETKATQQKGGVEIAVAPVQYELVEAKKQEDESLGESVRTEYALGTNATRQTPVRRIRRTTTTGYAPKPEVVGFLVTITNKMDRVFRGQGVVVQFNVSGQLVGVDQKGFAELANVVVPPGRQQQVRVYGPLLSGVPANAPVSLDLFDVVTGIDAAGVVKEKQNFTWFYTYVPQTVERPGGVTTDELEEEVGEPVIVPAGGGQQQQVRRRR